MSTKRGGEYVSTRYRRVPYKRQDDVPEHITFSIPESVVYCQSQYRMRALSQCGRFFHPRLCEEEAQDWLFITDTRTGVMVVRCPRHHSRQAWRAVGLRYTTERESRGVQAYLSDLARYGYHPPGPEAPIPLDDDLMRALAGKGSPEAISAALMSLDTRKYGQLRKILTGERWVK